MTTLHELASIFLIVLGITGVLGLCNYTVNLWRERHGHEGLLADLVCAILVILFFVALYVVSSID